MHASAETTANAADRLREELAAERKLVRRSAAFTTLAGLGLAVGLVAGAVGAGIGGAAGGADGPAVSWLARYLGLPGGASGALAAAGFLLAFVAGGAPAAVGAAKAVLRERKLDIDLLMVLAAIAAALVGAPRDGAVLLFLFSLAGTLEEHAFSTTKRAVAGLMELKPDTATLVEGDDLRAVSTDDVPIGATVLVRPGERVPLDGVLEQGSTSVDQSPITGESLPVDKAVGDALFAGSINGHGAVRMRVTKDASSSTLARMIELVTVAREGRAPSQRFSDWFGQRYTVVVLLGTAVALGVLLATGMEAHSALYKAATLLVVASPCAIVISVPAAVLSALSRAARMGVLFKGGRALEELGAVTVVAFDKTGTLTEGRMRVAEVVPFGTSASAVLAAAAAVEAASEHPLARALAAAAGGTLPGASDTTAVPGKGVRAVLDGAPWWVGNRRLAADIGVPVTPDVEEELGRLEAEGRTAVIVGDGERVRGIIAMADTVRPAAAPAIARLRRGGVGRIAMLTGDHPEVARGVAEELGIAADDVHAGLLPEEKVAVLERLTAIGKVAFVGDGVNDAAGLARAHVGIAMGAAGSDAALEAADVALLSDDLSRLPEALELARRVGRVIRQNLAFALGIMLLMVLATLFWHLPLPLGVLGHEGGTILVVANGLRLLGFAQRPRRAGGGEPVAVLAAGR